MLSTVLSKSKGIRFLGCGRWDPFGWFRMGESIVFYRIADRAVTGSKTWPVRWTSKTAQAWLNRIVLHDNKFMSFRSAGCGEFNFEMLCHIHAFSTLAVVLPIDPRLLGNGCFSSVSNARAFSSPVIGASPGALWLVLVTGFLGGSSPMAGICRGGKPGNLYGQLLVWR